MRKALNIFFIAVIILSFALDNLSTIYNLILIEEEVENIEVKKVKCLHLNNVFKYSYEICSKKETTKYYTFAIPIKGNNFSEGVFSPPEIN